MNNTLENILREKLIKKYHESVIEKYEEDEQNDEKNSNGN